MAKCVILGSPKERQAYDLGVKAFHDGKKAVPALDQNLLPLLKGNKVGEGLPVIKAWANGWHTANLAAPVPGGKA